MNHVIEFAPLKHILVVIKNMVDFMREKRATKNGKMIQKHNAL